MCCKSDSHKGCQCGEHHHGGGRHCAGGAGIGPSFWTTGEKIEWLEKYLEDLQAKVKSVQDRIGALKAEG